jgi:hypothetical protein
LRVKSDVEEKCIPHCGFYTRFIIICFLSINSFLVYIIMFTCNIITLRRIRVSRYRMGILQYRTKRHRNIDRHLITIRFIQLDLGMLLTLVRQVLYQRIIYFSRWIYPLTKGK